MCGNGINYAVGFAKSMITAIRTGGHSSVPLNISLADCRSAGVDFRRYVVALYQEVFYETHRRTQQPPLLTSPLANGGRGYPSETNEIITPGVSNKFEIGFQNFFPQVLQMCAAFFLNYSESENHCLRTRLGSKVGY